MEVKLDSGRTIPVVFGVLRPCLLLPAEAVEWDDARLRCVLLHEIAHIKRADTTAQLLTQIACAAYWFNPLVWLAARRLHAEAEFACDDLVLADGIRGSDYAEQLLHFAGRTCVSGWVVGSGLAMAQPSRLEGRLMAVLKEGQNRTGRTRLAALVTLLIGLSVIIPLAMLRAADEKKPVQAIESSSEEKPKTPVPTEAAPAADDKAAMKELYRVRLQQAEKDLKRAEELYRQKVISQADYERAQYEMARRRAELTKLNYVGTDGLEASTQSARADVDVAAAELALSQATLKRMSLLADQKAISQVEKEHAEAEVAYAEAKLRVAKARLERISTGARLPVPNNPGEADVKVAVPDTEVLEAELNLAKVNLNTSKVRLERISKLVEQGVMSRETLEDAQMDVDRAEAQLKVQKARLESSKKAGGF
jgi:multidrug resistance efflux pump